MRILIINRGVLPIGSKTLPAGGLELVTFNLSKSLANLSPDIKIDYITNIANNRIIQELIKLNINVINFYSPALNRPTNTYLSWMYKHLLANYYIYKKFKQYMQKYTPDIINIHGANFFTRFVLPQIKEKLVYTQHDSNPYTVKHSSIIEAFTRKLTFSLFEKAIFKQAKAIIYIPNKQLNTHYIPNGFDVSIFNPQHTREDRQLLNTYHLETYKYLLYSGALVPRKRPIELAKIFLRHKKLFKQFHIHKLVIVGNGELKSKIEAIAKQHKNIIFIPGTNQKKLAILYRHAFALILPSKSEALPLVLIEAMGSKCPVITTPVGSIPQIIKHKKNGFIINNLSELPQAIKYVKKNKEQLINNAYKNVIENFTWDKIAEKYYNIFKEVIAKQKNS